MTGLLVTGTDTGVGKTHVACALAAGLVARGRAVGVCKPCETGVSATWPPAGRGFVPVGALPAGSDAAALARAAGLDAPGARPVDARDVLPCAFPLPAAPAVAARHAGGAVDLDAIEAACRRLADACDVLLVEGAGGLLVPLAGTVTYADLARRLDLPLLIVARTTVGTLNHSALTAAAARAAGLDVLGLVLDSPCGPPGDADRLNLEALEDLAGVPVLGELPPGGPPPGETAARLADRVLAALDALGA